MMVIAGNKTFLLGRDKAARLLLRATKQLEGQFAIVALEVNSVREMVKLIYRSEQELNQAVATYEKRGIKVYYIKKSLG